MRILITGSHSLLGRTLANSFAREHSVEKRHLRVETGGAYRFKVKRDQVCLQADGKDAGLAGPLCGRGAVLPQHCQQIGGARLRRALPVGLARQEIGQAKLAQQVLVVSERRIIGPDSDLDSSCQPSRHRRHAIAETQITAGVADDDGAGGGNGVEIMVVGIDPMREYGARAQSAELGQMRHRAGRE